MRKEIKSIADEYDVEWDEKSDEATEEVHDALREERKKEKNLKLKVWLFNCQFQKMS